jgi:hypothetical protein
VKSERIGKRLLAESEGFLYGMKTFLTTVSSKDATVELFC